MVINQAGLDRSKAQSKQILEEANLKAETITRQATLDGKQQLYELKLQAEKELKEQRAQAQNAENKLLRREDSLNFREQNLVSKEKKLEEKDKTADEKVANLSKMEADLQQRIDNQIVVLERVAGMNLDETRQVIACLDRLRLTYRYEDEHGCGYLNEDAPDKSAIFQRLYSLVPPVKRYAGERLIHLLFYTQDPAVLEQIAALSPHDL